MILELKFKFRLKTKLKIFPYRLNKILSHLLKKQ